jgi:hypothetical protein
MAPMIDLERIDGPDDHRPGHTVIESPGPRGSRRTLVGLAAIALLVVGALVLLSGGGDSGDDRAEAPTTTERPPRTSRPPRSTTQPPSPAVFDVEVPELLRANLPGQSLYVVTAIAITRLEFDTGRVTIAPGLLPGGNVPTDAAVIDGKLVVSQPSRSTAFPADLSSGGEVIAGTLDAVYRSGRLFEIDYRDDDAPFGVQEYDANGQVINAWQVPRTAWVGGAVGDRLVAQSAGRNYLLSPNGEIEPVNTGDLLFVSDQAIVTRQCDDELACSLVIEDAVTRDLLVVTPFDDQFYSSQFGPLVGPDGMTAVISDDFGTPWLTDLAANWTVAVLDPMTRPAWSATGDVVVARSGEESRGIVAFSPGDGFTKFGLDLSRVDLGSDTVILAIG